MVCLPFMEKAGPSKRIKKGSKSSYGRKLLCECSSGSSVLNRNYSLLITCRGCVARNGLLLIRSKLLKLCNNSSFFLLLANSLIHSTL